MPTAGGGSVIKITEYGQLMSGGGVHVWKLTPELLDIFPLDDQIKAGQMGGGIVVRREIQVLQDWQEVGRVRA